MAITIELTFPAGRYHATPWGRHVNEGVGEWPPSPWRLLRALVAVWKRTCSDLAESQVKRVLSALVPPPVFHLPPHRVAHTRHYMPWEKKGPADRTLVFDTFVSIDRRANLLIHWPDASLIDDDRQTLGKLLGNLTFLGRAEGWVHGGLTDSMADWNCAPNEIASDPIPVFCPDPATVFAADHYPANAKQPARFLFDCPPWHLCLDTQTIHAERWPRVPGTRWVNYIMQQSSPIAPSVMVRKEQRPTFARFRLDAPVLPLVTETLPVAEQVRRSLLFACRRLARSQNPGWADEALWPLYPAFWGKDEQHRPLQGHEHAFGLPTDEDHDGRLDHLTIWAPMGFNQLECQALRGLRKPFGTEDPLRLLLTGLGTNDVGAPLLGKSSVWQSVTPFVVTRYPKLRGTKRDRPEDYASPQAFARHVLLQELRRANLPPVVSVEETWIGVRRLRSIQFKRFRSKRGDDGARRPAAGFRITFATAVDGPLCLGHSCHFGLGLFEPALTASREAR